MQLNCYTGSEHLNKIREVVLSKKGIEMMSIQNNAVLILRVMEKHGAIGGNSMIVQDVMEKTKLDTRSFDDADTFLMDGGYVDWTSGGPGGYRWLTPSGINFLEQVMSQRFPINLDAERILSYVINSISRPMGTVKRSEIQTELNLTDEEYDTSTKQLIDFGLAEKGPGGGVPRTGIDEYIHTEKSLRATQEGRQAYHRGFRDPLATSQPSQVFNIHAPSNIQAIATAINSQIEQTLTDNDPDDLRTIISEILTELVDQVQSDLKLKERRQYIQAAEDLEAELWKSDPEMENIQRWLARLTLLEKGISVSDKTLSLIMKTLPFIMVLTNHIDKLIALISR
jgi:hypothetical protein